MNTDRIETQGETVEPTAWDLMQATAKAGWDKIKVLVNEGEAVQYSINIGIRVEARGAIITLEKLFAKMATDKRVHNIQVVDAGWVYDIKMVDYLKAHIFGEPVEIDLITRTAREDLVIAEQEDQPMKSEYDSLEGMGKLIRTVPSDRQSRGKSNILQAMTLQALHHAFDTGRQRPYAGRTFQGNNAATTLLGNIGRRKVGGKK